MAYEGPRRTSLRQKGVTADGRMVDQELRGGRVVVSHDPSPWTVVGQEAPQAQPEVPKERHSKGKVEALQRKHESFFIGILCWTSECVWHFLAITCGLCVLPNGQ